jgi:hypothetical protein
MMQMATVYVTSSKWQVAKTQLLATTTLMQQMRMDHARMLTLAMTAMAIA